jgi:hypothetical protein
MAAAFAHAGNHLVGDSVSAINDGDDLSTLDAGESALDNEYGRGNLNGGHDAGAWVMMTRQTWDSTTMTRRVWQVTQ